MSDFEDLDRELSCLESTSSDRYGFARIAQRQKAALLAAADEQLCEPEAARPMGGGSGRKTSQSGQRSEACGQLLGHLTVDDVLT